MEVALREAKSKLSELVQSAERGEKVVITRHGKPVAEIVPYRRKGGIDFAELEALRKAMGIDDVTLTIDPRFDDPEYSREVLGLDSIE